MAACILRIDLSAAARDFQLVAVEAGVPLLDRTGANYATLRRWLGTFVAEPVWEADESVLFFMADEQGGRLEQVDCSPATATDLQGPLKEEVEAFLGRLGKIKPITDFEKQLLPLVSQRLGTLRSGGHGDEDCQFFKCRRGKGNWRLVWCWAHKRKDLEPATATICPREDCSQLYLVRRQTKARCPRCSAAARGAPHRSAGRKLAWAALVLLLLLAGAAAYLATGPQDLSVTPQQWAGPAGSRIAFTVNQRHWRFWTRDVTSRVVAQAHDRRKLEFEPGSSLAKTLAPGKTSASFFLDDQRVEAPVDIGPPKAPESMVVEPSSVSVPVGGTAPLKVIGKYGDDLAIDLSGMVTWLPQDTKIASVAGGRVEGQSEGKTTVKARFAGTRDTAPEATLSVTVTPAELKSLAIRFDPPKLAVGSRSKLRIMATDAVGREHEVIGSSQLKLQVDPPAAADVSADSLVGRAAGAATITATLGKLTAKAPFNVAPAALKAVADTVLSVQPEHLTMAVNETLPLSIVAGGDEPVTLETSDPKVVEIPDDDDMVVGRGPGHAEITVSQGDKHKTVQVEVVDSPIAKLRIEPMLATVAVGSDLPIRVVGTTKSGVDLQVAADRLKWSVVPAKEYAQFDPGKLLLHGVAPTPKEQELVATLGPDMSATAVVGVYAPDKPLAEHDTVKHPIAVTPDKIVGSGRVDTRNNDIDFSKYPDIGGGGGIGHGRGKRGHGGGGGGGTGGGGRGIGGGGTGVYDGKTVVKHRHGDRVVVTDGHTVIDDGHRVVGTGDRTDDVTDDALVVRDVRLLGVHISQITPKDFRAEFDLDLAQKGQYRLVDDDHQALSDWAEIGPASDARLTAESMPRTDDDEYDPFVERKIDGKSKYFQLPFALKLQK